MSAVQKFNVGDRVRHQSGAAFVTGIGPKGGLHVVFDGEPWKWADNVPAEEFALVEVAHYAPPGVQMVAVRPGGWARANVAIRKEYPTLSVADAEMIANIVANALAEDTDAMHAEVRDGS